MTLTLEQIAELKNQLRSQVENLPAQQKALAFQQIESMSSEALESLLKEQQSKNPEAQKPIFRSIISGDIPAAKFAENQDAVAVLDIFPLSKGHSIIIPKVLITDINNISKSLFNFAKKVSKKITKKLKPSSLNIIPETKFGEAILNVIPSYETAVSLSSPRSKSSIEELAPLANKLFIKQPKKRLSLVKIGPSKKKKSQILKLPRNIP